jgi:hypothetical protein
MTIPMHLDAKLSVRSLCRAAAFMLGLIVFHSEIAASCTFASMSYFSE